ncbi:hypothetical protein BD289DRAFT_45045 [Coniella lustricola]|uniref:SCD domain-containing protein n=1 Tax=Coniella lustricola TaxID=2025994 RepID=A0A2T3A1N8_9PEZI|nr:hypothetical protein BD289DRAFT_45045 [Coniella lustricola]
MPPARPPLMETSENTATPSPAPAAAARRSGRERRMPEKFQPEVVVAPKRKRAVDDEDDDDAENHNPEAGEGDGNDQDEEMTDDLGDEEDNEDEDVDSPDEEERRAARRPKKKASNNNKKATSNAVRRKAAFKKPKINGATLESGGVAQSINVADLPSRPKPKKTARVVTGDRRDGDGLYASIFGSGDSSNDVASEWYQKYRANNDAAVADLVNCVLLASGCDEQITEDDINDPDNIHNRLSELQDLYQEQQITDYPLAKASQSRSFRDLLVGFFESLINVLHETGALYTDEPLMENIARWIYPMSSSTLRPFRHTTTTVALAMELALAGVARKLDDRITKTSTQVDAEKGRKGKNKNKDMLLNLQKSLQESTKNREMCAKYMTDCFEVVFVHRYRDIDARIRTECVEALGSWIWVLPTVFMEPEYLRYLGWLLSDVVAPARQEVLRQLSRMFKRDAAKLGHFIDRFRPRLMEMATQDLDVSVRVAAINVIEALGENGMLEPDEIDNAGKLIFDTEPRVRKAVVKFFADIVESLVEQKVEAMGGEEAVEEMFPEGEEVDESAPRKEWIEIKGLAETLAIYESQLDDDDAEGRLDLSGNMISPMTTDTRMSLASQVLYDRLGIVKEWGILIGYLLHDHTTSTKSRSKSSKSAEAIMRQQIAPTEEEEVILLEVVVAAVKQVLAHIAEAEKGRRRPARGDVTETAEDVALALAQSIPKLLSKFGSNPKASTTVLRLSHLLDLDIFQQLNQETSTFEHLLDGISTQFSRQEDKDVVADAALALLRARKCDEFEEAVDVKISELWDNSLDSLRNLDKTQDLTHRGNMNAAVLSQVNSTLMKISNLAKIRDCIDVLEAEGTDENANTPAIDILAQIVHRGKFQQPDEELDDLEDEVTAFAIKSCHFYFMWKVVSLTHAVEMQTDIAPTTISAVASVRKLYEKNLVQTFSSRAHNDDLRLFAAGSLCDLHVTFASIKRTLNQWSAVGASKKYAGLLSLTPEIESGLVPEFINVFDGVERNYAKKAKKSLNEPADDEDPIDDEDEDLSDVEDDELLSATEKRAVELRAEKSLCELTAKYVLAILTRVVDSTGPHAGKLRKRLQRNATKLGKNYQETVAYLDEKKMREAEAAKARRAAARSKSRAPAAANANAISERSGSNKEPAKSVEIIVAGDSSDEGEELEDGMDEDHEDEEQPEEGTVEDLRRRELLDDPIEDLDSDVDEDAADKNDAADDDSILGD